MRCRKLTAGLFAGVLVLLVGLTQPGCGFDFGLDGIWDDSCYDCRTVCEGTVDEVLNDCLAACSQCQGSSECFSLLDGRFAGMQNGSAEWTEVDCAHLD
jgi:hypothetical protein